MSRFAPVLSHTSAPLPDVMTAAYYRAEIRTLWRRAAELDKCGDHDEAWRCVDRANAFARIERMVSWAPRGDRCPREVVA